MLKRIGTYLILACITTLTCGCPHVDPVIDYSQTRRTVLLYIAGNNTLGDSQRFRNYAQANMDSLRACSFIPSYKDENNVLLVYLHMKGGEPRLERMYRDNKGTVVEEYIQTWPATANSASRYQLQQVLSTSATLYPSKHNGLILWSHGTGWLPEGYYNDPSKFNKNDGSFMTYSTESTKPDYEFPPLEDDLFRDCVKSFGEDNGSEIEIQDLPNCFPIHYDYIVFDCCLMGGIEVAYQLRDCADFISFSQTEILADGYPYKLLGERLFKFAETAGDKSAVIRWSTDYFDQYNAKSGSDHSCTVSVVDCSKLDPLAQATRTIYDNHRFEIEHFRAGNSVQRYYRNQRHWFYDLRDYVRHFATDDEMKAFDQAIANAVVMKATTGFFLEFYINTFSGLSTYVLEPDNYYLNNYYFTLAWNKAVYLVH